MIKYVEKTEQLNKNEQLRLQLRGGNLHQDE